MTTGCAMTNQARHMRGNKLAGRRLRVFALRRVAFAIPLLSLFLLSPISSAAADLSNPDRAVEAGRDALAGQWDVNWYDAEADDYHTVDLTPTKKTDWGWLEAIFEGLWWLLTLGGALAQVIYVLMWAAAIALVAWLVYLIVRAYRSAELARVNALEQAEETRSHIERVEALPVAVERRVDDLLAEARRLHASGDGTLAVVYLFSHLLVELDKRRLLRLVKGKTNRQYHRELRRNAPTSGRLSAIVERTTLVFERAFFGAHPPGSRQLDACFAAVDEFTALANAAQGELA